MEPDTKQCPFCAETIKAEAIVCRYCGRDLTGEPVAPVVTPAIEPPKKNPAIGFAGLLVILAGIVLLCVAGNNIWLPVIVIVAGVGILVYALATGSVKLFG